MASLASTWDSELTSAESIDHLRDLASLLTARLSTYSESRRPLETLIQRAFRDDALTALAAWEPNYARFASRSDDFVIADLQIERQVPALFSKLTFGNIDRKAVALKAFLASEDSCKETNHLLLSARKGQLSLRPRTASALYRAKQLVARVLCDYSPSLDGLDFTFGPGATTSVKRSEASVLLKCKAVLTCAAPLFNHVGTVIGSGAPFLRTVHTTMYGPSQGDLDVRITSAVWDAVPKNYKTDRGICKEPDLNVVVQGHYGRVLQRALVERVGIDIRDQTRNQRLAREASISGDIATLDLSAASDSVSLELVYELLPLDWASALSSARSDTCRLPSGEVVRLHKFSSMGNGFTFPLETLIFWALCTAAMDNGTAVVYGDDIVVPTGDAENVIAVLEDCGFRINKEKSCVSPTILFRESCGCDYFGGFDIRPLYVRGNLSKRRLTILFNFFAEKYDWEVCKHLLPMLHDVPHGPPGYGDGHLHWSPFTPADPRVPYKRDRGFEGFAVPSMLPRVKRVRVTDIRSDDYDFLYAHILYETRGADLFSGPLRDLSGRVDRHAVGARTLLQDQDGFTVILPGRDEGERGGYHRKRVVVHGDLPDYTYTQRGCVYAGRLWDVIYRTGFKPRMVPCTNRGNSSSQV